MSPTLNGSSALQCFERGNVIEMCNGIMFDFSPGLTHIQFSYSTHYLTLENFSPVVAEERKYITLITLPSTHTSTVYVCIKYMTVAAHHLFRKSFIRTSVMNPQNNNTHSILNRPCQHAPGQGNPLVGSSINYNLDFGFARWLSCSVHEVRTCMHNSMLHVHIASCVHIYVMLVSYPDPLQHSKRKGGQDEGGSGDMGMRPMSCWHLCMHVIMLHLHNDILCMRSG